MAPQLSPPLRFLGFRSPAIAALASVRVAGCGGPSRFRLRQRFSRKRCFRSLYRFVLPAIEQIRRDPVPPTCVRQLPTLDASLHDLSLLFRGSVYAWFPPHLTSSFGAPDSA